MKGILYELILKLRFCNFHSSKKLSANLIKSGSSAPKEHVRSSQANQLEPHTKWLCKPWILNHFVLGCCQILQKVQNDKDDDRPQVGIPPLLAITCARYTLGIRDFFLLVYGWYTGLSFLVYVLTSLHTAWYTGSLWFGIRAVYAGIRCSCLSGIRKVYAGIR